jgi:DNA-binding transcriptional MerR regulator
MTASRPVQEFFSIGDDRVYQRREIELIMLVKHLLYNEKYTIEGARRRIEEYRRTGLLKTEARFALQRETIENLSGELRTLLDILDGKAPVEDPGQ